MSDSQQYDDRQQVALYHGDDQLISMIERVSRDDTIDIDRLDRLLTMRDAIVNRQAEALFNNAMADAQQGIEPVRSDCANAQTRSKYASYAAIDRAVRPVYSRHGFSLSFNTDLSTLSESVRVVCYVSHRGGFTRQYHVDVPADGKGAKGGEVMTRTHALGSAVSYGRRYLINMIFNIAIEHDDDGNAASPRQTIQRPVNDRGFRDGKMAQDPHPTTSMYERAQVAAEQGRAAFQAFCKTLTKNNYNEMEDYLRSLRSVVEAAEAAKNGKHQAQESEKEKATDGRSDYPPTETSTDTEAKEG